MAELGTNRTVDDAPTGPCVYMAQQGAFVKIGVTSDLRNRMRALRGSNPLAFDHVTVIWGGGEAFERELHDAFAEYRHHGEWFRHDGELADYIKTLKTVDSGDA